MTNTEVYEKIKAIEDKYQSVVFNMGLTHLIDVGVRHLTDEIVADAIAQIEAQAEEDKASGKISFLSVDIQKHILECAVELSKLSIHDLLQYVKDHLYVNGTDGKEIVRSKRIIVLSEENDDKTTIVVDNNDYCYAIEIIEQAIFDWRNADDEQRASCLESAVAIALDTNGINYVIKDCYEI